MSAGGPEMATAIADLNNPITNNSQSNIPQENGMGAMQQQPMMYQQQPQNFPPDRPMVQSLNPQPQQQMMYPPQHSDYNNAQQHPNANNLVEKTSSEKSLTKLLINTAIVVVIFGIVNSKSFYRKIAGFLPFMYDEYGLTMVGLVLLNIIGGVIYFYLKKFNIIK